MAGFQGELTKTKAVYPGRNENLRGQYDSYVLVCGFPSSSFCPLPEIPPSGEGQEMEGGAEMWCAGQGTEEPGPKEGTSSPSHTLRAQ